MSLSSSGVHQDATRQQSSASTKKRRTLTAARPRYDVVVIIPRAPRRDQKVEVGPRRKKGDEHPPPRGRGRMSFSSFRVHQDATGQQSSASTEKGDEHNRRADAVGCRCHRSVCTKTRPDIRVVPRRKK
ncbi:hypothetical protein TNCV_1999091 [Trichonephila clavipes]|nr:hypothetical protein TNCV_1999091 [Trichonephila clavipes]